MFRSAHRTLRYQAAASRCWRHTVALQALRQCRMAAQSQHVGKAVQGLAGRAWSHRTALTQLRAWRAATRSQPSISTPSRWHSDQEVRKATGMWRYAACMQRMRHRAKITSSLWCSRWQQRRTLFALNAWRLWRQHQWAQSAELCALAHALSAIREEWESSLRVWSGVACHRYNTLRRAAAVWRCMASSSKRYEEAVTKVRVRVRVRGQG